MRKEAISFMSACEMAEKIRVQELPAQEITETIIERIEKLNPIINAYCTPTLELARKMAKEADERVKRGEKVGTLNGVPISIKDETEVEGVRTTFGSKIFENNKPRRDDILVKRARIAGAVILGKTNTPAFGFKGETDNLIFGVTKNPWNLERTSGGSSGGAAAAVASGLSPLAIGSDGGGSIRIPSSFCGTYGFKSTFGRVPQSNMLLLGYLGTFVHKGPIVRFVKDAALLLDVLAGEHFTDRYSLPKPNYSYLEKLDDIPSKLKIGYSLDLGFAEAIDPEVEKSVLGAIQKFDQLNWSVEKSEVKIKNPEPLFWSFWASGFGYTFKPFLKKWKDKMDPDFAELINIGLNYSATDLKMAEVQREMVYINISRLLKDFDVIITPTVACPAFEIGKSGIYDMETLKSDIIINGKRSSLLGWLSFTYPFNISGHPAASIPCGWSNDGLPIGMQVVGKRFDELTLLQVSKAFEDLAPWQDKRPIIN
jgi:Asp-tRNA(Asn)/Glu-tRNA(Gln) amidotransferase A subunit family amidase